MAMCHPARSFRGEATVLAGYAMLDDDDDDFPTITTVTIIDIRHKHRDQNPFHKLNRYYRRLKTIKDH